MDATPHAGAAPQTLQWYDALPSTSGLLLEQARQGAPHGTLVAAGRQSAGHGLAGKPFYSPAGGLYFSLLLREGLPPAGTLPVTPRAALAARRVLLRYGCTLGVKWVNDLFREGRKAGGILAQAAGGAVVVGMGLNLYPPRDLPEELRGIVTSCAENPGAFPAPQALALEIAAALEAVNGEDNGPLLAEYRAASVVLGREVAYEGGGRRMRARAIDITPTGGLLLDSGTVLTSGEARLLPLHSG